MIMINTENKVTPKPCMEKFNIENRYIDATLHEDDQYR